MSIFVRQLGAITCEVKFDRHRNWIVTVIVWNVLSPPASLILYACSRPENKDAGDYTTRGSLRRACTGKFLQSDAKCGTLKVCGIWKQWNKERVAESLAVRES